MNPHPEHPFVTDYLRRFDAVAQSMAASRRLRLREDIEGHLGDAIPSGTSDADAAAVIAEFGSPTDIVAQEIDDAETGAPRSDRSVKRIRVAVAIGLALIALVAAAIWLFNPGTSPAQPAAEPVRSPVNATPEGPERLKEGLNYFEYLAAIERMEFPLPPGAEYPEGIPEAADQTPIEWQGLASNAVGSSIAHYTWLCAWETDYLDAFEQDDLERRAVAEVMINRWTETDYYATIVDPDQAWIKNVTDPMSFGKSSGVKADRGQNCVAAGIYNVGN